MLTLVDPVTVDTLVEDLRLPLDQTIMIMLSLGAGGGVLQYSNIANLLGPPLIYTMVGVLERPSVVL